MSDFTTVDGIVAFVIVLSAILAYSRGFLREVMAIAGWIGAGILAFLFAPTVKPLVEELPFIDAYLQSSCELSIIVSFVVVFTLALVVVSIFTPLLSSAVRDTALGPADQVLGFVFGVLRGVLLVAVALLVYDQVAVTEQIASVENSRTANIFARSEAQIDQAVPDDAPGWIVERYEGLVGVCGG